MSQPLMPKATAIWLIENTILTFKQIADFTTLHELEVQALADGDVSHGMTGSNPIVHSELTATEIKRCEGDESAVLAGVTNDLPEPKARSKGPKYTPISKRGDKPDAVAFVLRNHTILTDAQIVKLIGTTKNTINNVRDRTHANIQNIAPKDPVILGLCSQTELNAAIERAEKKAENAKKKAAKSAEKEDSAEACPNPVAPEGLENETVNEAVASNEGMPPLEEGEASEEVIEGDDLNQHSA